MTPAPPITVDQLRAIMHRLDPERAAALLPLLNDAMTESQIITVPRQAPFLAQIAHESVELRFFEETASGFAYEGRHDLGNIHPGDGPRFKGRGPIQLTGRANYERAGAALGLDLVGDPGLVATPEVGFRTTAWYWRSHRLNELADVGDFDGITKRINGGLNGIEQRRLYLARAVIALGAGHTS